MIIFKRPSPEGLFLCHLASHFIGSYNGVAHSFSGRIDDFRIYDRVLSANEIKAIYDSTK